MAKERSPELEEALKRLKRARSEIKKVHKEVSGYPPIPFTDEERELLTRETLASQETLALCREVIQPDSDVDVDRALSQIEERRQWGDNCLVCGDAWGDDYDCSCTNPTA